MSLEAADCWKKLCSAYVISVISVEALCLINWKNSEKSTRAVAPFCTHSIIQSISDYDQRKQGESRRRKRYVDTYLDRSIKVAISPCRRYLERNVVWAIRQGSSPKTL